jgi:hypothetical protein
MKKVFMTLTVVAFATSITFAQAPTTKPAVEAVKAAPAKVKEAAKPAVDAAQAAPAKVKKAVKPAMKMPTHSTELDSAKMASVKVKKAAKTTKVAAISTSTAMTFKCPKGDAVADSGGKCPKCGTEMVAIGATAAPKKAAKKAMKMEAAPVKKEEKKG